MMTSIFSHTVFVLAGLVSSMWVYGAEEAPLGMPIEQQWKGFRSEQEKAQRVVIRDKSAWKAAWQIMHGNVDPAPAVPAVDFKKHMVVAVFMGRRMTGGYAVKIVSFEDKEKLVVTVAETSPPKGAMVSMALTSPYHAVVIAKSDKEVVFVNQKDPAEK